MKTIKLMYWLQFVLSVLVAIASWRFLVFGVEASMEFMLYHAQQRPIWFFAHVGLAPVALLLMPFQHLPQLRQKHLKLHRTLGRLYVISVIVSGIGGLMLAGSTESGAFSAWGFGLLAITWLTVTVNAVRFAILGRIDEHQEWMIRSSVLTFAAVTLRLYIPLTQVAGLPFEQFYPIIAWACWVPNALLAEIYLRRKKQHLTVSV